MGSVEDSPLFSPPEPLTAFHNVAGFASGEPTLDDWLAHRAIKSQEAGSARTYVVCAGEDIAGFFSLSVGSILRALALGKIRRNMPDPIPVMILARLAVAQRHHGRGLGASLLQDAVRRTVQAAEIAGIRAIIVHAISQDAARFYQHFGFRPSSTDPLTLMARLADLEESVKPKTGS